MKRFHSYIALILVLLMLLSGCGKKNQTDGSAAPEPAASDTAKQNGKTDKKDKDKKDKDDKDDKSSPAPTDSSVAATPTADPVQQVTDVENGEEGTWEDVEQAQEDVMEDLAVSPTGNWNDKNSSAALVVDGAGSASILWVQSDGSVYLWQFTITQDDSGVMHYKDCVKQIQQSNQPPKVLYQNGTGTLTIKSGLLYWKDDIEDFGANCVFEKES